MEKGEKQFLKDNTEFRNEVEQQMMLLVCVGAKKKKKQSVGERAVPKFIGSASMGDRSQPVNCLHMLSSGKIMQITLFLYCSNDYFWWCIFLIASLVLTQTFIT